jgi:hypothetical protein
MAEPIGHGEDQVPAVLRARIALGKGDGILAQDLTPVVFCPGPPWPL